MARQKPEPILSITRFFTGMVTQRNPLNTPFSFMGLNVVQRHDALIGGSNCEISNNFTLQRRPGFPRYCPSAFASNEFPLAFDSFRLNGAVVDVVDTNLAVYTFTSGGKTLLFTKSAGAGQTFFQQRGNVVYMSNGVDNKKWVPAGLSWAANTAFTLGQFITDTNGNVQQVTTAGTSGGSQPAWNTNVRGTTTDSGITWTMRGTPVQNWGIVAPTTAPSVTPPVVAGPTFWQPNVSYSTTNVYLLDPNGNIQFNFAYQSSTALTTGSQMPLWAVTMGSITKEASGGWQNFGPPGQWKPSTVFPAIGPVTIIDTNGNLQHLTTAGTSGAAVPTWATTINSTTTDGTAVWTMRGTGAIAAFVGYQWVYAFHTVYGHVSTASPVPITTGPIIESPYSIPLGGTGSADPQCDYVWIFRLSDGGANYQFAAQVANPGNSAWSLTDTTLDANLNNQILAPLAHSNDPPPSGMTFTTFYMRRMWGAVGPTMQYGIGPDLVTGVNEECWPPANFETYPAPVVAMAPTSQGLVTMTYDQWWVELGGPQTLSFYPQLVLDNFGISSPNCLAQKSDQLYVYTTSRLFLSLSLTSGEDEIGFNIGDVLELNFNPATSYVKLHQNGRDAAVYLSDGSTNLVRYSLKINGWSTLYPVVGGVGAIGSVETAFGTYQLMAGRPTGSGFILARSLTNFYDDQSGSTYTWNAQIGSLIMSEPGTPTEEVASIVLRTTTAGSPLSVGVLANEISGAFVNVPFTCDDPHDVSGTPYDPVTIRAKRYDWDGIQQQLPNSLRHMQIQISGIAENAKSEVLGVHLCPQIEG